MKVRYVICAIAASFLLFSYSQEALANGHGRQERDYHRKFKRDRGYHFYHYPGKRYFIFRGVYYYYPRRYQCAYDYQASKYNQNYLPITVIVNMAAHGVPDAVIIEEIRRTHSTYRLDSETITYLKDNKVSDRVIDYMLQTAKAGSGY